MVDRAWIVAGLGGGLFGVTLAINLARATRILNCQETNDYCWDFSRWFAGDIGDSTYELKWVEDGGVRVGELEIHFRGSQGNRPLVWQDIARGTVTRSPVKPSTRLACEIKLLQWSHTPETFVRGSMGVRILGAGLPATGFYLESDWKDSPEALAILPLRHGDGVEEQIANLELNRWVPLSVDYDAMCSRWGVSGDVVSVGIGVECLRTWSGHPEDTYGVADVTYRVRNPVLYA